MATNEGNARADQNTATPDIQSWEQDAWWTRLGWQLAAVVIVVLIVAGLVTLIAAVGSSNSNTLPYVAESFAIQFLLLTSLGAIVTFLVDLERRTREARVQRRTFQVDTVSSMLEQLDGIYTEVKKTRRLLRVDDARSELDDARLAERMLAVNTEQEEAERLTRRMEALEARLPALTTIRTDVEACDTYLSNLWGDYEETTTRGAWLDPFIARKNSGNSNFKNFKDAYDGARGQLISLLGKVSTRVR